MKKCVGCGYCCIEMPCFLVMKIHGPTRKCPELFWNGERYICGIMEYRREREEVNDSCLCPSNTWRLDVKQRKEDENKAYYELPRQETFRSAVA